MEKSVINAVKGWIISEGGDYINAFSVEHLYVHTSERKCCIFCDLSCGTSVRIMGFKKGAEAYKALNILVGEMVWIKS